MFFYFKDKKADLVINTYVDDVMRLLLKELNIKSIEYNPKSDPTRQDLPVSEIWMGDFTKKEWTISQRAVGTTRKRLNVPSAKSEVKSKRKKSNIKKEKDFATELLPVHEKEGHHLEHNDLKQSANDIIVDKQEDTRVVKLEPNSI